ncbi:unnamed protein product [Dicrocoelium dendriticum]|nr:unnamed protein product [Dicrocoelium dendriticum]
MKQNNHHDLCFTLLLILCGKGLSILPDDSRLLLQMHNQYRELVAHGELHTQPGAQFMTVLTWDDDLARNAQFLASQCVVGHDKAQDRRTAEFPLVGQNWAGVGNYTEAVRRWFDENVFYNYWTNKCEPKKVCGHYTQIVWAKTRKLGCGIERCPKSKMPFKYSVVCNYGPAGNFVGQRPYDTWDYSDEVEDFAFPLIT